jgi:hypothetical protein
MRPSCSHGIGQRHILFWFDVVVEGTAPMSPPCSAQKWVQVDAQWVGCLRKSWHDAQPFYFFKGPLPRVNLVTFTMKRPRLHVYAVESPNFLPFISCCLGWGS